MKAVRAKDLIKFAKMESDGNEEAWILDIVLRQFLNEYGSEFLAGQEKFELKTDVKLNWENEKGDK